MFMKHNVSAIQHTFRSDNKTINSYKLHNAYQLKSALFQDLCISNNGKIPLNNPYPNALRILNE